MDGGSRPTASSDCYRRSAAARGAAAAAGAGNRRELRSEQPTAAARFMSPATPSTPTTWPWRAGTTLPGFSTGGVCARMAHGLGRGHRARGGGGARYAACGRPAVGVPALALFSQADDESLRHMFRGCSLYLAIGLSRSAPAYSMAPTRAGTRTRRALSLPIHTHTP